MRYALILIITFASFTLNAQDFYDVLRIGQKFSSPSDFNNSLEESSEINYSVDLSLPLKLRDSIYFLTGTTYDYYNCILDTNQNATIFHSVILKLGINWNLRNDWNATFLLLPKLSSDFSDFSSYDFQLGGAVLFKKNISTRLNFQTGIYYNHELYGPYLTPLLGIYYQSKNKIFEINMLLPSRSDLRFNVTKSFTTGLRFNSITRSFRITDEITKQENYLDQKSNELKFLAEISLSKNFALELMFGHSISRKYEVYEEGDKIDFGFIAFLIDDNRKNLNESFEDGFIREFKFIYRIPTN